MKYSINLEKNIIYCTFDGPLVSDDMINFITSIRSDPDFSTHLNTIADVSQAIIYQTFPLTRSLFSYIEKTSEQRGNFKLALIVSKESFDAAHLYKTLESKIQVKICTSIEEAEAWVSTHEQ